MSTRALTRAIGSAALLGGGLAGCVAGVDVSDEEYSAIQQSVGSASGGSGSVGTGATGGSQSSGGVAGTGNSSGSAGSSGSAQGGSGGSGSSGAGNTPPPAVGDCAGATAGAGNIQLRVFYTERGTEKEIRMTLAVENMGNGFTLSDLVLRYWFDDDGQSFAAADVDYVTNNSPVNITFGEALGSNYADINFTGTADIAQGIEQIQIRLHDAGYQTIPNQTNDFSFSAGASDVENRNITAYVNDIKVFGCEPGSGS